MLTFYKFVDIFNFLEEFYCASFFKTYIWQALGPSLCIAGGTGSRSTGCWRFSSVPTVTNSAHPRMRSPHTSAAIIKREINVKLHLCPLVNLFRTYLFLQKIVSVKVYFKQTSFLFRILPQSQNIEQKCIMRKMQMSSFFIGFWKCVGLFKLYFGLFE